MTERKQTHVRLAIREEGSFVNAYLALPNTMEGAHLIGSMLKAPLNRDRQLWEQWKAILTAIMLAGIEEITGQEATTVIERPAPEHERAGHG